MNRSIHIEHLRGPELETAIRTCPVIFVPLGVLEWHGPHLPLGTDAFEAVEATCRAARRLDALVYPTIWQHDHFHGLRAILAELFERLVHVGFRVVVLVTGHNGASVLGTARAAAQHLVYDRRMTLVASLLFDEVAKRHADCGIDHAAHWETSLMRRLRPDDVDMSALPAQPFTMDMSPPWGIGGSRSPLGADPDDGERVLARSADYLEELARTALAGLTPEQRRFPLPAVAPGHWWFI